MQRHFYLENIPLDQAQAVFQQLFGEIEAQLKEKIEVLSVSQANGRVLAKPVWAKLSSPNYHASAMDGYAVRSKDTNEATETHPIQLTLIEASDEVPAEISRPAMAVNTGHPMPLWANAVVMIENTQAIKKEDGPSMIEIRASLPPWNHVRPMGEDMVATELILPANHTLRPVDLGAIAGSGHATVSVYRKPRVVIIPTGSELVPIDTVETNAIQPGQIIEYNSLVLAAQVENWGGEPIRWPIVPDEFEAIKTAVQEAAQTADIILLNAGSSAGSEDYTAHVVQACGQLYVHGVAVRPGHPVILGLIGEKDDVKKLKEGNEGINASNSGPAISSRPIPIIGVPGYPVSAALTGELFIEPLLARWFGRSPHKPTTIQAKLTRKLTSHTGDDDFVRVAVGKVNDTILATPINRGAGVITSLVRADGLVKIPRFSEGQDVGKEVTVHLYRTIGEIEKTVLMIGSHDLTLDLLAQFLAQKGVWLTSANVGSLGGLVALRRKECHLAGSHLLNPETGIYNESYIRHYLPNQAVQLVHFVQRAQGWIVPAGNPRNLLGWDDISQPEIRMVNRQRGAGTRVLLDYELKKRGVNLAQIQGYDREEYTHLAVAAAVSSGTADVGLGVQAAARALQLDFVPLANEQYDLIIPQEFFQTELVQAIIETIKLPEFQSAIAQLPGYDISNIGQMTLLT